jgi:hypothetical protein
LTAALCQEDENEEKKKCNQVHQSMTLEINKYFALVVDNDA